MPPNQQLTTDQSEVGFSCTMQATSLCVKCFAAAMCSMTILKARIANLRAHGDILKILLGHTLEIVLLLCMLRIIIYSQSRVIMGSRGSSPEQSCVRSLATAAAIVLSLVGCLSWLILSVMDISGQLAKGMPASHEVCLPLNAPS